MGGGREAGVEQDGVVSGGGKGAPGFVGDVKGGQVCCVGEREGAGVTIDAVRERTRTGIGRFGAGVGCGCADAGLSLCVGVDAGERGRCAGEGGAAPEEDVSWAHPCRSSCARLAQHHPPMARSFPNHVTRDPPLRPPLHVFVSNKALTMTAG